MTIKQNRTIQNMLLSICLAIFISLVCATTVYAAYSDWWPVPPGTKSWAGMDTVDITYVSGTYHSIDLNNYGTNCSTVVAGENDGCKTFDQLRHGNNSRVLYQRKIKVVYNDVINIVAATYDSGSGGSNVANSGKFYWNVVEHDSSGNAIYDSGWMETSTAYKIGVTTTSNGLFNLHGYSRNNVAYIILVFRYATGDMSTGAPSPEVTPSKMAEELPNLYLCYNPFTYTVDNQGSKSTITRTGIEALSSPLSNPTKTGHTFTGWKVTSSNTTGGTNWMNGNTYSTSTLNSYMSNGKFYTSLFGNVTFTAQFTVNTYKVTYYGNGATGGYTSANTATYGQSFITTKNGYVKQGYQFNGWAKTAAGPPTDGWGLTSVGVFESGQYWTWSYTSDLNLYAQWSPNKYAINYYGNGETGGSTDSSYHTYGEWAKLSKNGFYKTGYTFRGWSPDTGEWSYNLDGAYRNFNTFNPAFYANAYSDLYNALGYNADALYAHYRDYGRTEGRVAVGDISDNRTLYPDQANVVNLTHDNLTHNTAYALSLFAQWSPNTYTVTLNDNGATSTNHTTSITATYDAAMPSITKPSRVYTVSYDANGGSCSTSSNSATYTFNGYYTATSGGTQYYKSDGSSAKNWDKTSDTTLYAQWSSASVTLPTPTRTGYTFKGWYEDSSFNTKAGDAGATYTPTKAIKLYAKWQANTYNVTLNSNGATSTNHTTSVTATYDAAMPSITKPSRSYKVTYNANSGTCNTANATATYTFNGYYTATSGGTQYYKSDASSAKNWDKTSATTLYAQWSSASVTLPTPTRTGYTFQGWYDAASGGNKIGNAGASYTPTKAITLYAQWKANTYTVTLNGNGATSTNHTTSVTATYDSAMPSITKPSRVYTVTFNANSGTCSTTSLTSTYTFNGYYDATSGGTQYYTSAGASARTWNKASNSTLYAQWTSASVKLPTPTRTGYTFKGWYTAASGGTKIGDAGATYTPGKAVTLYAQWTANTYNIYYNLNDISATQTPVHGTYAPTSGTYDQTVTISNPTMTGYTFKGWKITGMDSVTHTYGSSTTTSTSISSTTATSFKNLHSTTGATVTFTAQWEANTYTIKFDPNNKATTPKNVYGDAFTTDPTGTTTSITATYDSNVTLTKNGFSRVGYTFKGWHTNPSATTVLYSDQQSLTNANLTSVNGATVILYAIWEPITYTVQYNKGSTDSTASVPSSFTLKFDQQGTLSGIGSIKGTSYSLIFNTNKPSNATGTPTSVATISGNLAFNDWSLSNTESSAYRSGSTIKNLRNTSGTVTVTATWNNKVLNNYTSSSLTGWKFNGWYTSATGGNKTTSITVTPSKTAYSNTLYAQWTANTYNIVYDLNDISVTSTPALGENAPTKVTYDIAFTVDNPTMIGYTFLGWQITGMDTVTHYYGSSTTTSTSISSTKATSFKNLTSVDKNTITFKALWEPNTYYVDYNKGATNNGGTTSSSKHTYDTSVTLHANWFTGRSYSLYFKENKPKDDYGNITAGTVTNLQATKEGTLQFNNWYITNAHNNNNTNANASTNLGIMNYRYDVNGRATATAKWKSITLNNYASPTLTGYIFNGYYTATTGGTKTTSITVEENSSAYTNTLYAQWTPITYTIEFYGNGNWNTEQGMYTQKLTYDTHTALTANKFTRLDNTTYNNVFYKAGYEFVGWGLSPTDKTPIYTDGQIVNNLTTKNNDTIKLYAIWKKTVTLTIDYNGGKFNNSTDSKVLSYTMYNSELNYTFDIKTYYGTQVGSDYYSKGLNSKLTKTVSGVKQRFLGYSLSSSSKVPDSKFDTFAYNTRTEAYNIRDNTVLYAIWEPVLQMTVNMKAPAHSGNIKTASPIDVFTELGTFVIPSGIVNSSLSNNVTAELANSTIGLTVTNLDKVEYTVSAKGAKTIKFDTAVDSRILDIYTNGTDNTWYDAYNIVSDFNYSINSFSSVSDSFIVPQYLGTKLSHQSSNPSNSSSYTIYGLAFTCSQSSYYYSTYWNTDERVSVYCILFLYPSDMNGGGVGDATEIPEYSDSYFQTLIQ